MKLYKTSDETLIYTFFQNFANPETNMFDLISFQTLFGFLNLSIDDSMIYKMLICLKKFKLSHKTQLLLSESLKNSNTLKNSHPFSYSLNYQQFRELFMSHKIRSSEAYLTSEWRSISGDPESFLAQADYFLLRQILILFGKKIRDVSRVVQSLREHSADVVYDFMLRFRIEGGGDERGFRSHSVSPGPSFSNNGLGWANQDKNENLPKMNSIQEKEEFRTETDYYTEGESKADSGMLGNVMKGSSKRTIRSNLLNKFLRRSPDYHSQTRRKVFDNNYKFQPFSPNNSKLKKSRQNNFTLNSMELQEKTCLDLASMKAFFSFLRIDYLKEDLYLLMSSIGAEEGYLSLRQFTNFLDSLVWEIE
jgi:hypothetical protein